MTIRIIGAIFIISGCAGIGFLCSAAYRKEISILKDFIEAMNIMESELRYRRTPLPMLCHLISENQRGVVKAYFQNLEKKLLQHVQPDAGKCALLALDETQSLPSAVQQLIRQLGRTLGIFDLDGQLLGILSVKNDATQVLTYMVKNQEQRIKNYRTFGICSGAAIVILFI